MLISLLALSAFSIDQEDTSSRLSVAVTMLLVAVAYKLTVASSLPDLAYLTVLGM